MATISQLYQMQIGDRIITHYKASANTFGTIDQLGTSTAPEIPVASTATPDGSFYFYHAGYDYLGRMKLVADRNVQHSITYDTLNSAGVASGSGLPIQVDGKEGYTIRLLTGGVIEADKDNEWDKIIAESSLNGTITPGDNIIWNCISTNSWVSTILDASNRVARGFVTIDGRNIGPSTLSNATTGFRPVLLVDNKAVCNITKVTPTHLYAKQHSYCDIEASADLGGVSKAFRVTVNGVEVSALDLVTTRRLPISAFTVGTNTITVIAEDGGATSVQVVQEAPYRTSAERTMLAIDGGYLASSNLVLDGKAKSSDGSIATLQTIPLTAINLQGYSGIDNVTVNGVGGKYAVSFDGGVTYKVHTIEYTPEKTLSLIPNMTSNTAPYGVASESSIWAGIEAWYSMRQGLSVKTGGWFTHPNTTGWIAYDFRNSTIVTGYSLQAIEQEPTYFPKDWAFEGTDDDINWITLDTHTNFTQNVDRNYFALSSPANYKKYKVNMTNNTSGHTISLYLVELFGYSASSSHWVSILQSEITTQGMTPATLNAITPAQYASVFQSTQLDILASLSGTIDKLTSLTVTLPANQAPIISNVEVTPTIHVDNVEIKASLTDLEQTIIRYQVLINANVYQDWIVGDAVNTIVPNELFRIGLNPVTINAKDEQGDINTSTVYVTMIDNAPYKTIGMLNMLNLIAEITDVDNDPISYRILLNNVTVQDWSVFSPSPVSINYLLDRKLINFGVTNTVTVEYKDILRVKGDAYTESFIGSYYGLLFADEAGDFYSTDAGIILKRMDMDVLTVGQTSVPQTAQLINTSGIALKNIVLSVAADTVAMNTSVKLDYDSTSFDGKDVLTFASLNNGDSILFQVQVSVDSNAQSGSIFRIFATGEPL